jgi:CheY-like chemotaxis protein
MSMPAPRRPKKPAESPLTPGTILLVENESGLRDELVERLASSGFAVRVAPHGIEALRLLAVPGRGGCVVLLDLAMPFLDLFRILDVLRDDDVVVTLPLVIQRGKGAPTPSGDAEYAKRAIALPALVDELRSLAADTRTP